MNAGKLVAQLAVVAIIAYCCYGAIVTSLPMSQEELEQLTANPFEVDAPTLSGSCDGMNFKMTMTGGMITSHLPADIADVYVTLYVGAGNMKLDLGTINVGTLVPDVPTPLSGMVDAPIYALLAYSATSTNNDGVMSIPLCMKVGFKYFEWQGSHLLDLSVTLKNYIEFEGTTPEITTVGDNAKVDITLDDTKGGLLEDAATNLKTQFPEIFTHTNPEDDGKAIINFGDAQVKIAIDDSGSTTKVSIEAIGGDGHTAAEIMKNSVKDDGTLDLSIVGYTDPLPALNAENTATFIAVIESLYNTGGLA
ncbi:MAG: hypothetical protein MJZ21_01700 [archaeon]|nr:hypothetical protein [archaeon]